MLGVRVLGVRVLGCWVFISAGLTAVLGQYEVFTDRYTDEGPFSMGGQRTGIPCTGRGVWEVCVRVSHTGYLEHVEGEGEGVQREERREEGGEEGGVTHTLHVSFTLNKEHYQIFKM